jgi:hypothetical protein
VVGCTTGSRGEVPGERKPVIRDDDNDNDNDNRNTNKHETYHQKKMFIAVRRFI